LIVAHYGVTVKPPATPVPAATLVLLRDRPTGGFELCLIQRHAKSKFAAGDFVFPGGKVEVADNPEDATRWCAGPDAAEAARILALDPATALAYWIGVIRETFEEIGVLLASDGTGRPPRTDDPRFEAHRRACHVDQEAFWNMVRTEGLTLATGRLTYVAHWITPEESPLRFDTRFFAAAMPGDQQARADGHEIVAVKWFAPEEALAAAGRGEISLRNPTARNIQLFDGAPTVADALARLAGRTIPTVRPRIVIRDGARQVLMPGDAGYW
jgi:8-oxo-dGTP pyrophosphatase MutT (NUDIX family)